MNTKLAGLAFAVCLTGCPLWGGCIARGSRVWTPDGWRPIEDLVVGDAVYAVDEASGELVETVVTATRCVPREVGLLEFDGGELSLTSDHPVYCPIKDDYFPAGDWFLDQRAALLLLVEGEMRQVEVTNAKPYVALSDVFDITVEHELHNFIVEGVLVHNKSPGDDNFEVNNEYRASCYYPDYPDLLSYEGDDCWCNDGAKSVTTCSGDVATCEGCSSGGPSGDMGTSDAGSTDAGTTDAGATDVGSSDVGARDSGTDDAGNSDMGAD